MKPNRIYADTSVSGGVFDDEFAEVSVRFFDEVSAGRHVILLSETTARELQEAPIRVKQLVADLPAKALEQLGFTDEMAELQDAFLQAKVVGRRWSDDAAHVASATVAHADAIVSWNFRHIVKLEKIRAFNAISVSRGYPPLTILSPREVISDEQAL